MTFDEYQDFTSTTAKYPPALGVPYTALGLAGEVGEVVELVFQNLQIYAVTHEVTEKQLELLDALHGFIYSAKELQKISKCVRGDPGKQIEGVVEFISKVDYNFDEEKKKLYKKELSDCQWFTSEAARTGNSKLSEIAKISKDKLTDRLERGVIKGDGDNR